MWTSNNTRQRPRDWRSAVTCALLSAAIPATVLYAGNTPPAEQQPVASEQKILDATRASPLFQLALEELGKLEPDQPRMRRFSRQELVQRNLSRFFVRYSVPEQPNDLQRLLGTAQRTTRDAGRLLIGAANSVAQQEGAAVISEAHLSRVTQALLPFASTPTDDRSYFPSSPDGAVLIERWDLEALADTGMVWEVLGGLAESVVAPNVVAGTGLDLTQKAAVLLADTLTAYGLLVFRLGGEIAAGDLQPQVATRHLRDAVKILRARADGQPAPIAKRYQPRQGSRILDGEPLFVDASDAVGLTFEHTSSDWIGRFRRFESIAPTFSGGGAAAADVNGDGWVDVVVCGGHGCVLLRNNGGKTLEDVTATAGVNVDGEARMPILADFDNDGDPDLFVTYARDPNRFFVNDGKGVFSAQTASGLETEGDISGPAAAVDVDNDGLLDLYVGNFGNYLAGQSAWAAREATNGMPNRLYRNLGSDSGAPRFEDITRTAGVADTGWAQALSHVDVDRDGDQDIYIANDFGRNQLYLNNGDATFAEAGASSGSDDAFHGMNVSFVDLNQDSFADIFITNIWFRAATTKTLTETNTLLMSAAPVDGDSRRPAFVVSDDPMLREVDSGWGWAALFFDLENDGDDDLFVANGFTDYMTFAQYRQHPENADQLFTINNGREANRLFLNPTAGEQAVPDVLRINSGTEFGDTNTRSAITFDFDRDGDLDLFLTTFHDRARLLLNEAPRNHDFLQVNLSGDPRLRTNRDAIGAQLILTRDNGKAVWRTVAGGEGYLGQSDLAVEFGTGGKTPRKLEILWPNGQTETITNLPATGRGSVRQGSNTFRPEPASDQR